MENEETKCGLNTDENEDDITEQTVDENDELVQDFLNTRRTIQRMNRRRDAWTRR